MVACAIITCVFCSPNHKCTAFGAAESTHVPFGSRDYLCAHDETFIINQSKGHEQLVYYIIYRSQNEPLKESILMSILVIILISMKRPVITSLIDATEGVGSNANF